MGVRAARKKNVNRTVGKIEKSVRFPNNPVFRRYYPITGENYED